MASFRPLQLILVIENFEEFAKSDDVVNSKPALVRGLRWTLCANATGNESSRKLQAFVLCEPAADGTSWDGYCAASYDISLLTVDGIAETRTFGEKINEFGSSDYNKTSDKHDMGYISCTYGDPILRKYAKDGRCELHANVSVSIPRRERSQKELGGEKSSTDDVTFRMGERLVYANKGYLSVVSPVFERMFNGEFREKDADVVSLEDIEPKDFLEFIKVVYPSRKKVDRNNVFLLMVLAERFDVGFLLEDCMEFIRTEQNNVPAIEKLCFAEQWEFDIMRQGWDRYQDEAIASLSADQITSVRKDKGFKKLSVETITDLMDRYMSLKA